MRAGQAAREGTPLGLTGATGPTAVGTSRGHHLATEPGWGLRRTLPCSLPQGRGEASLPPLPGQCPPWAQCCARRCHCQRANGRSLFLHLCPSLAGGEAQVWRSRRQGQVQGCTGLKALRSLTGLRLSPVPLRSHCLPSTAVAGCQELRVGSPSVMAPKQELTCLP